MKALTQNLFLLITFCIIQTTYAGSKKDAEIIFEQLISPTMIAASEYLKTEVNKKPELQKGSDFLQKIDFNKIIVNSKKEIVTIISKELTDQESNYLANYLSQPAVIKYNKLAIENRNYEKAMSMLDAGEQTIVAKKDYDIESSIGPKFNQINTKLKSIVTYNAIDELENIKDEIESMGKIDDACKKAYDQQIYNSGFLVCGLGYKLNYKESSKVFAKMNWRGDYLERDFPKAMEIYKQLLKQDTDPEVAFLYGVLNYNTSNDENVKRTAACWINLAATQKYDPAIEFYNDIKDSFSNLPKKCEFIKSR